MKEEGCEAEIVRRGDEQTIFEHARIYECKHL